MRRIFILSLFLVFAISNAYSQSGFKKKDDKKLFRFDKPSIELSYGISDINLSNSALNLTDAGLFELKLGFTMEKESKFGKNTLKYDNKFLFLSNASNDNLSKNQSAEDVKNSMWRFGFGDKSGYGVKLGSVSILPYNSGSFAWTEFEYEVNNNLTDADYSKLEDFKGTFRFGSTWEGGINFQIFNGFSIEPKYEISDVFPRHLFGKQLMSSMLEATGLFLIDGFTTRILKNSPVAGTFVNFVLKNAYEFGFYQLRRSQMNWPFTSTAPLRYNTFKLGMTFIF